MRSDSNIRSEHSENRRNDAMNLIKFIALIGVLCIHIKFPTIIGTELVYLSKFAVPLFFAVSGYYTYHTPAGIILKRAGRMFRWMIFGNALYFFWDLVYETMCGRSAAVFVRTAFTPKKILVFLVTNESYLRGHLWFLGALTYCYLVIFALKTWKMRALLKTGSKQTSACSMIDRLIAPAVLLLLAAGIAGGGLLVMTGHGDKVLSYIRNWLFEGLPCMGLGYLLHRAQAEGRRCPLLGMHAMALTAILIVCGIEMCLTPPQMLLTAGAAMAALCLVGTAADHPSVPEGVKPLGDFAKRYGLWVYVLQIIPIEILRALV